MAELEALARHTEDTDVVCDRRPENVERLVMAVAPHAGILRAAPEGLPSLLREIGRVGT